MEKRRRKERKGRKDHSGGFGRVEKKKRKMRKEGMDCQIKKLRKRFFKRRCGGVVGGDMDKGCFLNLVQTR